ncbi:DUF6286 domain-containing protein [Streptomyces mirabilis]|nr:DUF6286 domain-containing protein [Streptomyces mirabilis]
MTKEPQEPREPTETGPPEDDAPLPPDLVAGEHDRRDRSHRPWSARRVPAALVASVILVAAVAALVDVVAVRAGRPAAGDGTLPTNWPPALGRRVGAHGAAVAAVLGIWLIVLAVTPAYATGCPSLPAPGLRASLDRDGAADLLRDAAIRVPRVSRARVRVRRHRVKARADIRFRDPQRVKEDLTAVLDEERDQLVLARPPRIVVRVRQRTD